MGPRSALPCGSLSSCSSPGPLCARVLRAVGARACGLTLRLLTRFHLILKSINLWHQGYYQNSKLNESKNWSTAHFPSTFELIMFISKTRKPSSLLGGRHAPRFLFQSHGSLSSPRQESPGCPCWVSPGPAVRCPRALAAAGALLSERTARKDLSSRGATWGPAGPGPGGLDNAPTAQLWGQGHVLEPAFCGSGWHP